MSKKSLSAIHDEFIMDDKKYCKKCENYIKSQYSTRAYYPSRCTRSVKWNKYIGKYIGKSTDDFSPNIEGKCIHHIQIPIVEKKTILQKVKELFRKEK